jgi:hypothetical protein
MVTITDFRGVKHSVEVTAESLFEAATWGWPRSDKMVGRMGFGAQRCLRCKSKGPLSRTSYHSNKFTTG